MKKTKGSDSLLLRIRNAYRGTKKKLPVLTFILTFILAAAVSFPLVLLAKSSAFRLVDYCVEDTLFQHAGKNGGEVVLVGIREADNRFSADGRSESEVLAELVSALNEDPANAPAVIGIALPLSDRTADYGPLIAALSSADNVVLSSRAALPGTLSVGDDGKAEGGELTVSSLIPAADDLLKYAPQGHMSTVPDTDGYVRHYAWDLKTPDGEKVLSFAEAVYAKYCEKNGSGDVFVPHTSEDGFAYMKFSLKAGDLREYGVSEVLSGAASPADFRGKAVLVGTMDAFLTDSFRTAVSRNEEMPAVEFQGGMVYNLIHRVDMQDGPMMLQLLVLWALLTVEIMLLVLAPVSVCLIFAGASVALAFGASAVFFGNGYAFHPCLELVNLIAVTFLGMFFRFQTSLNTQERTREIFSRYVDSDILNQETYTNPDGRDWKSDKVVVMFADLRSFTTLSETVSPDELLELLNRYLSMADEWIHRYNGRLDKFIGDCVMATWSLSEAMEAAGPHADERQVEEDILYRACCAALEIVHACVPINEELEAKHNRSLRFGIGIHYGEAVMGNVGSENHMNLTAIGDTVNVASRLESIAPSGSVYITDRVAIPLKNRARYVMADSRLHLKGRAQTVTVYALQSMVGLALPALVYVKDTGESFVPEMIRTDSSQYVLYILGSRGSRPVEGARYAEFGGQTSCYIIKTGHHALVVDCGTGLYDAAPYLADCTQIDVVLTHVHYDHILGILCWGVFPVTADLTVYGSFDKWFGRKSFEDFYAAPFWPVQPRFGNLVETPKRGIPVRLGDGMFVSFFDSPHPDDTCIVKVNAGDSSICFMADCELASGMPQDVVENSDILIYDGMFKDEEYPKYAGFGHSTWQEGCRLAERAHVGHLIITHHDPKNSDKELMAREYLAKQMFPHTSFARAGDIIRLNGKKQ